MTYDVASTDWLIAGLWAQVHAVKDSVHSVPFPTQVRLNPVNPTLEPVYPSSLNLTSYQVVPLKYV